MIDLACGAGYRPAPRKAWCSLKWWKWTALALVLLLGASYGVLSYLMGGPRDVYGFLRYALPQWRDGDLHVGDRAPDVRLLALDGQTTFHLSERVGQRPLVLIFGSYT